MTGFLKDGSLALLYNSDHDLTDTQQGAEAFVGYRAVVSYNGVLFQTWFYLRLHLGEEWHLLYRDFVMISGYH